MNVKTFPSLRSAVTSLIFIVMMQQSNAADYYVAVDGSDTNPGSLEKPFKTMTRARDAVRADGERGNKPVMVYLRGGTHYLPETIAFGPQDSGSTNAPVTYAAYQNEAAVLSGGMKLDLDWKAYRDEIFVAKTPEDIEIDQLFIDGNRQRMARYPNYEENAAAYNGSAADAFEPSRAKHWKDPTGGYIHAMHRHHWGGYHYRITGKDADNRVTYEGGWQNNRQMGMHPSLRMVENLFEELDAPREWYHDAKNNLLYYMPDSGTHLKTAKVEVVRLRHLVEFQGSKTEPVKHISLQGLTLRHTARTFMETKEPLLRSDWTIYRGGAVLMTGTDSISILDCEFDQVGGNAIFVNNYNRHSVIRGCHIHGAGASGICFVGDPNTVRNPRFEYQQQNQYDEIDKTAGPKTNNYPADCVVDNCLIHHMSVVEKQATGVQISMSKGIKVSHCSIYNLGRAGINISEGTFGGHVIEFCDVFDTVRETGDHGSFNSWGRDRFWHLPGAPKEELPALSKLDTVKTIIRNSRWRCDHGWDVDLDDGSSHYEIYNNVFLSGGLKLREGFGRKVYNNIAVNNTLHPHVWYDNSQDIVTGNIWMDGYRPAGGMPKGKWGKEVDRNLFTSEADRDQFRQHDCDQHSVVGDPMFVDAEKGDYRVKEGSPAHRIGFKNFPMDQFGVKKPSLKAIARTPVIPILKSSQQNSRRRSENQPNPKTAAKPHVDWIWLGATLKSLTGSEFSAYGISKTDGGIVLVKSPQGSEATRLGLQAGDVIQQVNGKPVKTTGALLRTLVDVGPAPYQLKMVRSQQATEIRIAKHSYVHTEIASELSDFKKLPLKDAKQSPVTANQNTNNQPLATLTDGRLAKDYGPVFSNGVHHGAYKLDLGSVKPVTAITSWSFNQSGTRGGQKIILLGSAATNDPGWNLTRFTPIGSIDTAGKHGATYTAASLRAAANGSLGSFRWIVWQVVPVTDNANGENTAYQELQVQFETD